MKAKQLKRKHAYLGNWGLFFLSLFACAIPFFLIEKVYLALFWAICILTTYLGTLFFWIRFLPFYSKDRRVFFQRYTPIFRTILFNRNSVYRVENGYFDKDYFAIKNKPAINGILIDANSAIVLKKRNGDKFFLTNCYRQPSPGEKVIHVFKLSPSRFPWGTGSRYNPFQQTNRGTNNLKVINVHNSSLAHTICHSKDGTVFAPVFSIYYAMTPCTTLEKQNKALLALSALYEKEGVHGNLAPIIEQNIGNLISCQFREFTTDIDLSILLASEEYSDTLLGYLKTQMDAMFAKDNRPFRKTSKIEDQILKSFKVRVYLKKVWVK